MGELGKRLSGGRENDLETWMKGGDARRNDSKNENKTGAPTWEPRQNEFPIKYENNFLATKNGQLIETWPNRGMKRSQLKKQ